MPNQLLRLSSSFAALVFAVGCGSAAPSPSDVRKALDNPTGSVNDKGGVTAAAQRQSANGPSSSFGTTTPFGGGALTLARQDHRAAVDPLVAVAPFFKHVERRVGIKPNVRRLTAAQENLDDLENCFGSAFTEGAISPDGNNFDLSVDVDFDSCGDGSITGKMSVDMSGNIDTDTGEMEMDATYSYSNLCITQSGVSVCQNGVMEMSATGKVDITGTNNGEVTMEMIAGWKFTVTISGGDKSAEFTNKGGLEMKIGAGSDSASASLRMVVYVTLPSGEEVSYTFSLAVDDTMASFEIAGRDGKLSCTVDAEGNGMCTGDLELSWTAEEWNAVYDSHAG